MGRGTDGEGDGRLAGGRETEGLGGTGRAAAEASGTDGAPNLAELRASGFGLQP